MSSEKQPARISFDKNKVASYDKSPTGITATNVKGSTPTTELVPQISGAGELSYNSTDALTKNLELLGEKLRHGKIEQNDAEYEDIDYEETTDDPKDSWRTEIDQFDDLCEDDIVQDLDRYIGNVSKIQLVKKQNKNKKRIPDNFCRNCGDQYYENDNFCGSCGSQRLKPSA